MRTIANAVLAGVLVALPSGAFAQSYLSDATVCKRALKEDRSGWVEDSDYTREATKRGLTFRACDEMGNAPTPPPARASNDRSYSGGGSKMRAFLEAATYFVTALDVSERNGDIITDSEIRLGRYPIVIYPADNGCGVRVRTTTAPYTIWKIDFCKIAQWQSHRAYGSYTTVATWYGDFTAFCILRDWRNENYEGVMDGSNSKCSFDGPSKANDEYRRHRVWHSLTDIDDLVNVNGKGRGPGTGNGGYSLRPVDRMIASYKYINTLLSGKPY